MSDITTISTPDGLLAEKLASFGHNPLDFVLFSFPWGEGELSEYDGPEEWQAKLLKEIGDGLKTIDQVIREAVSSGHGVGKSALVSWLILWGISTKADTRGVVTANTDTQLKTKTWPELAKWYNLFIGKKFFILTATSIYSSQKDYERTWRIDAIPWSETRTESFAGMHNKGKRILFIFDEGSSIPNIIWEVSEGALTDKNTEIIWCVFGNPTRNTGRFHDCFTRHRALWGNHRVDARTVKITNKEQIKEWVDTYGEDSDFVKVRVKGEFPSMGDRQFISNDIVGKARGRHLNEMQYGFLPVVIGVDPGWSVDEGVIYLRQGLMSRKLMVYHGIKDDSVVAGYVAKFEQEYNADAVFIDLGYGTGIYSIGKQMGRQWQLVAFGGASTDEGYLNKRADMWRMMRDWLRDGGAIEEDDVLCRQLTSVEYVVCTDGKRAGKVMLEKKEDMAKRGIESPNRADALALTFAFPVLSKSQKMFGSLTEKNEYDPLSREVRVPTYNPLSPLSKLTEVKTWRDYIKA